MGMVASPGGIGSAFLVCFGQYGDVRRVAQQHGVSRQGVYREAQQVVAAREGTSTHATSAGLQAEVTALRQQVAELQQCLEVAVVLDAEKQAEFAGVGQSGGVRWPPCHTLREVLIPGQALRVASLGRRTQRAARKASLLLQSFDASAQPLVREGAGDAIYVSAPVLRVVEQASWCGVGGRLSEAVSGEAWSQEFARLPHLEPRARDGGSGLAKGVALVNARRPAQGQASLVDPGDHFHALRKGGVGLCRARQRVRKALAAAESAQHALEEGARQGRAQTGRAARARRAWKKAEQALDAWQETERVWQQTKDALPLITPPGGNTRAQAEAVLAQTLPQLSDSAFAKTKRQGQRPEMLNYLARGNALVGTAQINT